MAARRQFDARQVAEMLAYDSDEENANDDFGEGSDNEDILEREENHESDELEYDSDKSTSSEDTDEEYRSRNNFRWSKRRPHSASYRRQNIVRTRMGLKACVADYQDVQGFFLHIMTSDMLEKIRLYTNKRIPSSEKEITEEEIIGYVGLLILFGVTRKQHVDISEIWKKNSPHFLPIAQLTMSRDSFQRISRYLTFDDIELRNDQNMSSDKLYKCKELFHYVKNKIGTTLQPGENLCVDETLYPFHGKCRFRQYMPNKPAKYGLKYWNIVDCKTGYLLDTDIYLGKEAASPRNKNIGEQVVLKLAQPFFNSGRGITTDNFFTSRPLAEKLWDSGLTLLGTIRKSKPDIPKSFLPHSSRELHSSIFGFCGYLTLCSYVPKKKKAVVLLSTQHHSQAVAPDGDKKPDVILTYNATKGAVDAFDQKIEKFSCRRRTCRWTVNVFFYLIDVAATNAVILMNVANGGDRPSGRFRRRELENLAYSLIKPCILTRVDNWRSCRFNGIPQDLKQSTITLGFLQIEAIHDQGVQGRCFLCLERRRTQTLCSDCSRNVCKDHQTVICLQCNSLRV